MIETRNKNYKFPDKLFKSGSCIYAEYKKWLYQSRGIDDLKSNEISTLDLIAMESFMYGKRWTYMSYKDFNVSKNTLPKILKSLSEKELLKYENTRIKIDSLGSNCVGKNKYSLIIPKKLEEKFKFYAKGFKNVRLENEKENKIELENLDI